MAKGVMTHKGKKESIKTARNHKQELESDEASVPKNSKTSNKTEKKNKGRKYVPLKEFKMADYLRV